MAVHVQESSLSALTFDANAGTSLQSRALDRALAHLLDEQRQVIPLVGLEGMRYEEAATIRSIPIGHRPLAAVGIQQRLFDAYAAEVRPVAGNADGIVTALQGDIDTPTNALPTTRLYLPPIVFNRFAVTRKINDGLLARALP